MSSTQSVPSSSASKEQIDTAAKALEALAVAQGDRHAGNMHAQVDEVDDDDDDDELDGHDDGTGAHDNVAESSAAGAAAAEAGASKKKKKKSKSKGKGKGAMDKLKNALTGGSSEDTDVIGASPSSSVAGKKGVPPISDKLYQRILSEAKKNLSPEEAAKLDRQAVAEMVEGDYFSRFVQTGRAICHAMLHVYHADIWLSTD